MGVVDWGFFLVVENISFKSCLAVCFFSFSTSHRGFFRCKRCGLPEAEEFVVKEEEDEEELLFCCDAKRASSLSLSLCRLRRC